MLKGQIFVVRCYAHILNVVALDVLASIHGIIYNIRESIKYVKASPSREEKFAGIVSQLQIPPTRQLSLDVLTQWNTTYHMLLAAFDFKQAFVFLESCDDNYNEAPSPDDWRKVEIVCTYLKLLYDSAKSVTSTVDPTANIFFHDAWKIQLELTNGLVSEDIMVRNIVKEMHEKFDKYWKDCSLVLAVAVVMDPRFKMKLVEFSFTKIYGDDDAPRYIKVVNDVIHELFFEYVSQPLPLTESSIYGATEGNKVTIHLPMEDGLSDFDKYLSEIASNHHTKSELDQYLEETLVPRIPEFDLLNWWKLNTLKYPTLSMMARDVLSIPMSMVSTGSVFGPGSVSRVLDDYRSSLQPETVEALFCLKDWLQYVPTMMEPPSTPIV
nr:zinc finger BED domain-containing protein RICESLEEPER 2 [Lilium hybrid division I]